MPSVDDESRRCTHCGERLPLSAFGFKFPDGRRRVRRCRICVREISRAHYRQNASLYKQRAALTKVSTIAENRARLRTYLLQSTCADCGETDLAALEFDHRDPSIKRGDISRMVGMGCSWHAIQQELAKCDVVCANCHRRRTAGHFKWRKTTGAYDVALPALPQRGSADYERIKSVRSGLARRHRNRGIIFAFLREHPCALCGEADPVVLDFDHLREKRRDVSVIANLSGRIKLMAEIAKCRVLCANCHRRHTAETAGRER